MCGGEKIETFWTSHKIHASHILKDIQPNNYLFPSQTIKLFIPVSTEPLINELKSPFGKNK